ncbi:hypothetical protein WS67_12535 [Burkholderia singularis]|uniref:Uncharacterized protein n=1 Tax=Burkholderia singularis TaxID=1503053 RepID=A0A103E2S9_9BURK|nr:hypothetical protein WS67_12535 [Burkholderia singularis]
MAPMWAGRKVWTCAFFSKLRQTNGRIATAGRQGEALSLVDSAFVVRGMQVLYRASQQSHWSSALDSRIPNG